ncbi:MAG TPA: hypothetical protein PK765_03185 [bacterium]|nr:hypothetical protein [bacterium]
MRVYVCHSKDLDYRETLYRPVRERFADSRHEIIFPYELCDIPKDSLGVIRSCDLMVAEVSFPSTGLGIEIGWAHMLDKPIVCIHAEGTKISGSLRIVTDRIHEYRDEKSLVDLFERLLFSVA